METLLIVEDDRNQRALYRMELEDEGYRVVTACGGQEALQAAALERPDLVVLNPHMRGREADGALRRIKAFDPDLPVIAYTGYTLRPSASQMDLADACLVKSSDLGPLKRAVSDLLARTGEGRRRPHLSDFCEVDLAIAF